MGELGLGGVRVGMVERRWKWKDGGCEKWEARLLR